MMWWCQLLISNSGGVEEFQVSPGESILFALICWNSMRVFLPGILATSEWLDQQPDLAPSSSSGGPCAVTLGCSLLCCPWAQPWWAQGEQSRAWHGSLPSVLLGWKAGKGWRRTAATFMVSASPWTSGDHKHTLFSYLLIHKFIHLSMHSFSDL